MGFFRSSASQVSDSLGFYKKFRNIDISKVQRLVFACRGNICRSPYGEYSAKQFGWDTCSFGIFAAQGAADPAAMRVAGKRGIDLTQHRSLPFAQYEYRSTDLILCFEPWQAEWLWNSFSNQSPSVRPQITLVGLWLKTPRPHIEDPYLLSDDYFNSCYELVDEAIVRLSSLRSRTQVLVTDAHTLAALATIRSLGRAGYTVHAASADPQALGLASRFASHSVVCPKYTDPSYLSWLDDYLASNAIQLIIPLENFLNRIEPHFEKYKHLLPFSDRKEILYAGLSKIDLFEKLLSQPSLRDHLPPSQVIHSKTPSDLKQFTNGNAGPYFIKTDAKYSLRSAEKGGVVRVADSNSLEAEVSKASKTDSKFLLQSYVAGRGVGVFFIFWKGQVLAYFMHLRIHEVPHTGGYSSLRKSFFHQKIFLDAFEKLKALQWEGPAMMEYRWDEKTDDFYLMELNSRFWGSLHLPLQCGVDFPEILARAFRGKFKGIPISEFTAPSQLAYKQNIYCRWAFPGEVQYTMSLVKDPKVSSLKKLKAVFDFLFLTVNFRVQDDLSFPGDRFLFWINLKQFILNVLNKNQKK
jgi:protein-tyrosine-phosphatase